VVKTLCYKSEGRWFDSSWIFHWYKILLIALWPWRRLSLWQKWVPGAFPGCKGGRCVRLTTLPPSRAVVSKSGNLNFLEPSGPVQACNWTAFCLIMPGIGRWDLARRLRGQCWHIAFYMNITSWRVYLCVTVCMLAFVCACLFASYTHHCFLSTYIVLWQYDTVSPAELGVTAKS
jgi:hypothetical protein